MALAFCLSPNVLYSSLKFHDSGFVFLVLGFGFKALFDIISLITSRSLIRDELEEKKKTPDLPMQNLASHMWPELDLNQSGERPHD